ncbi:MAG: hypothetical protein R3290_10185 [Acidimicrobiia bacterium]|nr:hypothetical protein [Acidimicrobiia bacterium]
MPDLAPAFDAFDDCDAALVKLEKLCCDPGRSPRMAELGRTVDAARTALQGDFTAATAEEALEHLENAGAQLGRLQVGCCAPKRLPLYARMLENLTTIQLTVNRELGRGH